MDTQDSSRRDFLKKTSILAAGVAGLSILGQQTAFAADLLEKSIPGEGGFTLPPLPYAFDALEPHIDRMTMEIHHGKHHQAYITNLNKALAELKETGTDLDAILKKYAKTNNAIRNNGGGHYNHSLFWKLMRPAYDSAASNKPTGKLGDAITATFGSFDTFKEKFSAAGKDRFGSGWVWLLEDKGKLTIGSSANQDNPLMEGVTDLKGRPVLALDVWEHAYYLKYQNKRPDYMAAWWNVVNWEYAAQLFDGGK